MYFLLQISLLLIIRAEVCVPQSYPVARGAQIRLSQFGLQYGASIGIRKLQQELTNKAVDSQSGSANDVSWRAQNILIHYVQVESYAVQPLQGVGLRLTVGKVSVSARGKVSVKYQKGWVKVGDTTNVKIKGSGVGFTIDVRIDAKNGKPTLSSTRCSASISDVDLDFSGGLSWLYNLFSSLLESKMKDVLKMVMCTEGIKLVNNEANRFLLDFPVRQNIENWAIIDYSFERPVISQTYLDLLLRGEFLDRKNPVPSSVVPPSFNTNTDFKKMAYVWLSDFTLNSAGRVFHNAGLLKNQISPLLTSDLIPASLQPFLNTRSFEQIIPELFKAYPDRPIQFDLETYQAPTFDITPGSIDVKLYVSATIEVMHANGTTTPVFSLKINVNAAGSIFIKSSNSQLIVGGNVANFSFTATVGGSIIGDINIPLDNQSIKQLVRGLVIDQANPLLNKGFPIPKIKDLNFRNPVVAIVKDALRVETDIQYDG